MTATWGQNGSTGASPNYTRQIIHLTDGAEVFLVDDAAGANVTLYYSTDHVNRVAIATWALGGATISAFTLCVDKAGNIYVQWSDNSSQMWMSAFVRNAPAYSWTPSTPIAVAGAGPIEYNSDASSLFWCNTGGGANGAGHLFCAYRTIFGYLVVGALDAGVALAGSGAIVASAFTTIGTVALYADASPDGFGSLQGLLTYRGAASQPSVLSWRMSTFGVVTTAVVVAPVPSGFSSTNADKIRLISFGPGSGQWVLLAMDNTRNYIAALSLTMTAAVGAPVNSNPSGGDWATASIQLRGNNWDVFSDPNALGRVWVITWGTSNTTSTRLLGLTCSTMVWDTTDILADAAAATSLPVTISYQFMVRVVNEPLGPVTDYIVGWYDGTATRMGGDFAQPNGSVNTPTNLAPGNNAYADVTQPTVPLSWTYNNADGPSQAAFAIRFKIAGAASYRYWDVAGGISSEVPVWNPSTVSEFDMPSAAFLYGNAYLWSVATQSSTAVLSGFAAERALNASAPPNVTFDTWIGPFTNTSYPKLNWQTQTAVGTEQTTWHLQILDDITLDILYDTGVVFGEDQSLIVPIALANNTVYQAQITVTQTGGLQSATFIEPFAIATQAPAMPALTVMPSTDPATGAPRITLSAQSLDNLLSAIQSSFETAGVFGWTPVANCTLTSPVAAAGGDGNFAMQMKATAAGNMSARTVSWAAVGNRWYSGLVSLQAGATPRNTTVTIAFEDAAHALIVSYVSGGGNDVVGDFTRAIVMQAQSPPNTAFVYIIVSVTAAAINEIHLVDKAGIFLGQTTTWNINNGGYSANFFYSDDRVTWMPVRGGTNIALSLTGVAIVSDYESPPTRNRYYRAQMAYDGGLGLTQPIVSAYSPVTFGATEPGTDWWIKDPVDTSVALAFNQDFNTDVATNIKEKTTLHPTLGRKHPVAVSDGMTGEDGSATIAVTNDDDWQTLVKLMTRAARTLLLQSPFGYQWYVNFNGARNIALPPWTLDSPLRNVQIPYVEVDTP